MNYCLNKSTFSRNFICQVLTDRYSGALIIGEYINKKSLTKLGLHTGDFCKFCECLIKNEVKKQFTVIMLIFNRIQNK